MIGFDSMNAAHLLNEELQMSLQAQASIHFAITNWGKGSVKFGEGHVPPTPLYGEDGMGFYCGRDTGYTQMLYETQRHKLAREQNLARLFKHLVLPGLDAYTEMELNGIWVDTQRVDERRKELHERILKWDEELAGYVTDAELQPPDFGNEHFLRKWLFSWVGIDKEAKRDIFAEFGLHLPITARTLKTRVPQVDEAALERIDHPAAQALMARRHDIKGLQFFASWEEWAEKTAEGWYLHPSFNLTGAVTGRRSCNNPNLQQVPRNSFYRSCLGAPPGWYFLEVDYSQIEVRLAAWEANETNMLKIFSDPHGDIYRYTAAKLMHITEDELGAGLAKGEAWAKLGRQKAKAVVLGFLYGMGWRKFSAYAYDMYGVELTDEEAEEYRNIFFEMFPRLLKWHEWRRRAVGWVQRGETVPKGLSYQVESLVKRVRHLRRALSDDWTIKAKAERQAINSPIQGMGGDLTLAGVVSLSALMDRDEVRVVGDVHDALLFQIRADHWKRWTKVILETMESAPLLRDVFKLNPPLRLKAEAKVGRYWGEPKTYRGDVYTPEFSLEEVDGLEVELAKGR